MDGLKPVLEKLLKSELFNTIIPGRLYPTRTSHGKILELRVCKSSQDSSVSNDVDILSKNNSTSFPSYLKGAGKSDSNVEGLANTFSEACNVSRKKADDFKLENRKYSESSNLKSNHENFKGDKYGERTGPIIKNNKLNDIGSKMRLNDCSRGSNDKATHKVLARCGSLIQEVGILF